MKEDSTSMAIDGSLLQDTVLFKRVVEAQDIEYLPPLEESVMTLNMDMPVCACVCECVRYGDC